MSYEKHTWETGEVITAAKLNNIENGIESTDSLNLVNGIAINSLRVTSAAPEDANYSLGISAFAEGYDTKASGADAHAEGFNTVAYGDYSHVEGSSTLATKQGSHAEGGNTQSVGEFSHTEGRQTTASGNYSHAEGYLSQAHAVAAHAEGNYAVAAQTGAHAEGSNTNAYGLSSHAEGYHNNALGDYSHAEGNYTVAARKSQHVFGEYNVEDTGSASTLGTYVEIVGNGLSPTSRSNARTLDWSGNESIQGSLTLGKGTADETTVTATQLKTLIGNGTDQMGLPIVKLIFTYEATTTITCETGYNTTRGYLKNFYSIPIVLDRYISNTSQHYYEFATLELGSGNDLIITSLNSSSAGININCYTLKFSQGTISEVIQTTKTLE